MVEPLARSDMRAVVLGLGLATSVGVLASQPAGKIEDGTVRSQLTLGGRPVTVATLARADSDSEDDEAAQRALLSSSGPTTTRLRVGLLHSHPQLRIGELDGSDLWYDLWLTRTDAPSSWILEAQPAASGPAAADHADHDAAGGANMAGTIPLSHETVVDPASTLSLALVPTGNDGGRLVIGGANHRWTAEFGFAKPPPPPPQEQDRDGAQPERVGKDFDQDNTAVARAITLAARQEAALTLLDDSRISVLFGKEIGTEHDDFAAIAAMADGDVIRLTEAAVIRLRTEVPLRFGGVTVPTDNLAPGFPGSYGLWLKRVGSGWRLIFNHEADSWGTQHHPEFDAGEIDLTYSQNPSSAHPLGVALIPTSESSSQLVLHWGPHVWTTEFTVGS